MIAATADKVFFFLQHHAHIYCILLFKDVCHFHSTTFNLLVSPNVLSALVKHIYPQDN